MNFTEKYVDEIGELNKLLLILPALLQTGPSVNFHEIQKSLKAFDATVKVLREQLMLPVLHNATALEAVAATGEHWQQSIIESIYELKQSEYNHLLSEPNVLFNLYLRQYAFPEDGLKRILTFFTQHRDKEIYDLKIPLKELLSKNKNLLEEILSDIENSMSDETSTSHPLGQFIVYLHSYFRIEIISYLERLRKSGVIHATMFADYCETALQRADSSQKKIEFATN